MWHLATKPNRFLAGESYQPRGASTCFRNSFEEIECREDKIKMICSALTNEWTRMGWNARFTSLFLAAALLEFLAGAARTDRVPAGGLDREARFPFREIQLERGSSR
jgi:hypothetical protein